MSQLRDSLLKNLQINATQQTNSPNVDNNSTIYISSPRRMDVTLTRLLQDNGNERYFPQK